MPPPAKRKQLLQTLRVADPQLRNTIDQGLARSWTLRQLESRLEQASVIVYLSRVPLIRGMAGRTRLIGAGGGWRFLSVEVDDRIAGLDLLTVVGHELRHAVEIADAAYVVDADSMLDLYRRIGQPSFEKTADMLAFETQEALETSGVCTWSLGQIARLKPELEAEARS